MDASTRVRPSRALSKWVASLWAVLARGAGAMLVLVVLSTLVFLALRLLPGDPATLILGDQASAAARALLRARLGLDQPLLIQYFKFWRGLLQLDLGESLSKPGAPALLLVGRAFAPTASLAAVAVLLGAVLGVALAVVSVGPWLGRAKDWVHRLILGLAATPLLAFAPLFTFLFAVHWRIVPLPGDPDSGLAGLLFASALLGLPLAAQVARIGRAALLMHAREKFLDVARAKGASPLRVWLLHALPVSFPAVFVVIAAQLGALLGGAVVLERLFERPGLGTLMLNAYAARDIPVLEGAVLAAGTLFVIVQAAAGAINAWIDPRGEQS
ncbi:MAG TPA: ABC transporter permease [Polyangiaceae bacterium]|nr:ABC transporter permease [Polyangiaceae bacterium]